jgi:hypothetical protein
MSDQQKQPQLDAKEEDIRSMEGSEWPVEEENIVVGNGNAKQKEEESNPKIALLEVICEGEMRGKLGRIFDSLDHFQANNKILVGKLENLEGKLENLELKAQIRAMTEEANLNKLKEENNALKEENKAIRARMETAEEKVNKVIVGAEQKKNYSLLNDKNF